MKNLLHRAARQAAPLLAAAALSLPTPAAASGISSANVPLDSPIYDYLGKLSGFGLIRTDLQDLRPFSKGEAARLVLEAQGNLDQVTAAGRPLAEQLLERLEELLPREIALRRGETAPLFDFNKEPSAQLRFVQLDGVPRSYRRQVYDSGGESAFGFIGGNLRRQPPAIRQLNGTEGTPLMENNEGINYRRGSNFEARVAPEGYLRDLAVLLVEPDLLVADGDADLKMRKGYLKVGGGGAELEVGRDASWFGPGCRGALTLSNNARNFDLVKISSPEPLDFKWLKEHLGLLKYAVIFSRFDESGTGKDRREPYFFGAKLTLKPATWFEIGGNFVRQEGGPGLGGNTSTKDFIFGGGLTNKSNTIAGIDMRFRIPQLRNTELYGEYVGEDSAGFWPFVESYVAGFYIPCLTASGKDDLRFEYFWGHPILYTDWKFPEGYTFHDMTVGHSQGGGAVEYFTRYSHWFTARTRSALEYLYTKRGQAGRLPGQALEEKHAVRGSLELPVSGEVDLKTSYGWETIRNYGLVPGEGRNNQLFVLDLRYHY